jgi:hypothetical protein
MITDIVSSVLRKHCGQEGGAPRIDYYKLRNELVAALTPSAGEAEPVAWQHRIRPNFAISEWSPWLDGRAPQLRTDNYEAEERPLFASPSASEAQVRADRQRIDDALVSAIGLIRSLCSEDVAKVVRQELEYVRSAISAEAQVRVKALEWRKDRTAKALGATWMVWPYSDPLNDGLGNWLWQVVDVAPHASGRLHTEAEAKAAAQRDFEERILLALEASHA